MANRRRGHADHARIDEAAFKRDYEAGVLFKVLAERYGLASPQAVLNVVRWMGLKPRRGHPRTMLRVQLPDDIYSSVRQAAGGRGMTMVSWMTAAIREKLKRDKERETS